MIPMDSLLILIFGTMLAVLVGAIALTAIAKKRLKMDESENNNTAFTVAEAAEIQLPRKLIKNLPKSPQEEHQIVIAIENRARDEALRIALELGYHCESGANSATHKDTTDGSPEISEQKIWVLAGPGPLGAIALGMVRHLEALGFKATAQLLHYPERMSPFAKTQLKTLEVARHKIIDQPTPGAFTDIDRLIVGVDPTQLPTSRQEDFARIQESALESGVFIDELEPFDVQYVSPPPLQEDPCIPIPGEARSREDVRLLDSLAQDHYGMAGAALMENAGYWAAREAFIVANSLAEEKNIEIPKVSVLCGGGNNGGDGFVIARYLRLWGLTPDVFILGNKERMTDDSRHNFKLLEMLEQKVIAIIDPSQWTMVEQHFFESHLIVDALLGTGMTGTVRGEAMEAISCMNRAHDQGTWILAVDGPSGLDCNTGEPLGISVCADITVTFAANKTGFQKPEAQNFCGTIVRADIGLPREIYKRREKGDRA